MKHFDSTLSFGQRLLLLIVLTMIVAACSSTDMEADTATTQPNPVVPSSSPLRPSVTASPHLGATVVARIAAERTSAARIPPTARYLSPTTTASAFAGTGFCTWSTLQVVVNGAYTGTGGGGFSIALVNRSSTPCLIANPFDFQVLSPQSQPLLLRYSTGCFMCNDSDHEINTPPVPTQRARHPTETAVVAMRLSEPVVVAPGQGVSVVVFWDNWCGDVMEPGVLVKLRLGEQTPWLTIPTRVQTGGRCDNPAALSGIWITQYEPLQQTPTP